MISQVRGTIASRGLDRVEVLTASGVAYDVHIPLSVLEKLPRAGDAVVLHTAMVTREDGSALYGFIAASDRELFKILLTASGVGPSLALGLLSAMSPPRLIGAIRARDIASLQRVPRVGKKTAERLCVELGDKLKSWDGEAPAADTPGVVSNDAVRALVSLGYSDSDADRAVRSVVEKNGNAAPAEIVKKALAALQGR
ncbi:MAG TPA: Holliday junction branch migration protein RuvA [Gemmatimonadaceae bacterium]|nr:Holliday junction branch migration protein RuvA [Gemmatimonadaceae bacterium]